MMLADAATQAASAVAYPHDGLGKTLALLNAVVWAIALIFFKKSGDRVSPVALNLFKNTVGIAMLALTLGLLYAVGGEWAPEWPKALTSEGSGEFWLLVASGILGIAVADSIFFYALNRAGVGLIAIVDCLYTPFVMIFAAVLLGEPLTTVHYIGAALIIGAVFISSGHAPPRDRTRRQLLLGVLAGVAALAIMAFGIVWAKPVLGHTPVLWAALIRFAGGNAALALFALCWPGPAALREVFTPSSTWRTTIPGAVFGAYLAMICWIGGFTYTSAAASGMLNQSSSVFALILATVVLREPLTKRKISSLLLATVGVFVVILHDQVQAWLKSHGVLH